jgi:predicted porin
MTLSARQGYRKGVFTAVAVMALTGATTARADITLYDKDNWTFATDGRAQGFYSLGFGDSAAKPAAPMGTLIMGGFNAVGDSNQDFTTSRMRGGWAATVLGVTAKNKISETLSVSAHLAFWYDVANDQAKGPPNNVGSLDIRQGFLKLESTSWGGLLIGRNLGLHPRQEIIQNAVFTGAYAIGSPCNITGMGITCGQAGYGVVYPGFNPGIVYNTPELQGLQGFQLSVGAYDPVRMTDAFGQTPLPRLEFEATYHIAMVDTFASGMWQEAIATGGSKKLNAVGIGGGARATFGPFKVGALVNVDKGGGMYIPIGDVTIDSTGELRTVLNWWLSALYTIGQYDISAGFGEAHMAQTSADEADTMHSLIKNQIGWSVGVLYHLGPVGLDVEWFHQDHEWWGGQSQKANLINAGATVNW